MSYGSAKGYRAEHAVEELLQAALSADCYRPRAGRRDDVGDIGGLPAVISVKDHARLSLASWCDDLKAMVARTDLTHGVVWHKRAGRGDPLNWYVSMPGQLYLPALQALCVVDTYSGAGSVARKSGWAP